VLAQKPFQLSLGQSSRPERVVSDLRMDAGSLSSPPNHPVGIRLAERPPCECIGFPGRRAEQRPLGISFEIDALDVGFQIFVKVVMEAGKDSGKKHTDRRIKPRLVIMKASGAVPMAPALGWD
jgi:hypothetical protein